MVGIQIIVDFDTVFRQQRMVYSVLDKVIQYFETAMVKVGNHILFHQHPVITVEIIGIFIDLKNPHVLWDENRCNGCDSRPHLDYQQAMSKSDYKNSL